MCMCRKRALAELWSIVVNSTGNIIITAHAGVNRLILSELSGIDIEEGFSLQKEYGTISTLEYDGKDLKIDDIEIHI